MALVPIGTNAIFFHSERLLTCNEYGVDNFFTRTTLDKHRNDLTLYGNRKKFLVGAQGLINDIYKDFGKLKDEGLTEH